MKIGNVRCSVLVVDDDPEVRGLLLEVLNEDGAFVAVGATNGQDALRQLKAGLLADVILTDLMMPVMNGMQLRQALSREPAFNAIPIIVLSGEPRAIGLGLKVDGVLEKPVDLVRLFGHVMKACAKRHQLLVDAAQPLTGEDAQVKVLR